MEPGKIVALGVGVVSLILLVGIAVVLVSPPGASMSKPEVIVAPVSTPSLDQQSRVVTITLSVNDKTSPWTFLLDSKQNPTFQTKAGDKITVILKNTGQVPHDFTIDELKIATKLVSPGDTTQITFTPTQTASYTYYCAVPGHKELGMKGTINIE